jgi:hypothetical protein
MTDAPKSALDLVMERLRRKDAESGTEPTPLTDAQRTAIAEVRSIYESQAAERRIMHQSAVAGIFEPDQLAERDAEMRRDLERYERERDEKIKRIRESGAKS